MRSANGNVLPTGKPAIAGCLALRQWLALPAGRQRVFTAKAGKFGKRAMPPYRKPVAADYSGWTMTIVP